MAPNGASSRKDRSLSSASATKMSPSPECALLPDSLRSPPMAKDGSAPQACTATVSIEVVEVLPCVPATATLRRPAMTAASATARGSTRRPRSRAAASSGLSARIAVETTTVSTSPRWAASWPTATRAPSARSASSVGVSRRSLPETGTPRASRIRAMPLIPAPPMPMKCTAPSSGREGTGPVQAATSAALTGHLQHEVGQLLVGIGRAGRLGVARVPREPLGVGEQRYEVLLDPGGAQVGVLDQQPAAGVDHRLGVAALLAVADRQRDVGRGQADGGELGDGDRAGAAQGEVGGGVGEVHAFQVVDHDVGRGARRGGGHP